MIYTIFPPSTILELRDEFGVFSGESRAAGLSGELKYLLLDRNKSPVGLAVSFEPEWRSVVAGQGSGTDLVQFQTKAMADAALVPERVFVALNASWEPQVTWTNTGETIRDTNVEISAALAGQISEGLFAGGEVRYLASFEGLSFARSTNSGIFIGPTLYAKLSERAFVAASWSIRIGGVIREREPLPDFGNVPDSTESHHVRLRAGVNF
jgi:hypothetical protein